MSVPQFTTPTFTLEFDDENLDLTEATDVYVSFRSRGYLVTKDASDLTIRSKAIDVYLTQNETSRFAVGNVEIQANWLTPGGHRASSDIAIENISEQLLKRVI